MSLTFLLRLETYLRQVVRFCIDEVQSLARQHRRTACKCAPIVRKRGTMQYEMLPVLRFASPIV
jgi:hypothetical protein